MSGFVLCYLPCNLFLTKCRREIHTGMIFYVQKTRVRYANQATKVAVCVTLCE